MSNHAVNYRFEQTMNIKCEAREQKYQDLECTNGQSGLVTMDSYDSRQLLHQMHGIMTTVITSKVGGNKILVESAAKILFRSSIINQNCEKDPTAQLIVNGVLKMIENPNERTHEETIIEMVIMMFASNVAIESAKQNCRELLHGLIGVVENNFFHHLSVIRMRTCRLVRFILGATFCEPPISHDDDLLFDDDIDDFQQNQLISESVLIMWLRWLSKAVRDRCRDVRMAAVTALARMDPHFVFSDENGIETTSNKLISKSMLDIDLNVRYTAVKHVHITGSTDIDRAIDFIEKTGENKIRHMLAVKLSQNVHILSYTELQRYRFINVLRYSKSARTEDVIHQYLVENWMNYIDDNANSLTFLTSLSPNLEDEPIKLPYTIFEFLDPIVDPEATAIFLKFAIIRYIKKMFGRETNKADLNKFLEYLLEYEEKDKSVNHLMTKKNFTLLPTEELEKDLDPSKWIKMTYYRMFFLNQIVEVIKQMTKDKSKDSEYTKERFIRTLLPDTLTICSNFKEYCLLYYKNYNLVEESGQLLDETAIYCIDTMKFIIDFNDVTYDRTLAQQALEKVSEDPSLRISTHLAEYLVSTMLDVFGINKANINEVRDLTCYKANMILISTETGVVLSEDVKTACEQGLVLEPMLRRCASMLLGLCKNEEISSSVLMRTLFRSLFPLMLSSENIEVRFEGIELVAYSAIIDLSDSYLNLICAALEKTPLLTASVIHAVINVIKAKGYRPVALKLFEDEVKCEEDYFEQLAKFLEDISINLDDTAALQAARDFLSLLSHCTYLFWPKIISFCLRVFFDRRNRCYGDPIKFFSQFCRTSVRRYFNRISLMRGFIVLLENINMNADARENISFIDITSTIASHLCEMEKEKVIENTKNLYIEMELVKSVIRTSLSCQNFQMMSDVYFGLTCSLTLDHIPLEKLTEVHDMLKSCFNYLKNTSKTVTVAIKKLTALFERTINMKTKVNGESIGSHNDRRRKSDATDTTIEKKPHFYIEQMAKKRKSDRSASEVAKKRITFSYCQKPDDSDDDNMITEDSFDEDY